MNCRKRWNLEWSKLEKFRTSTGYEPVTLLCFAVWCQCTVNLCDFSKPNVISVVITSWSPKCLIWHIGTNNVHNHAGTAIAMVVQCSNSLNYDATHVGNNSIIMDRYVWGKEMMIYMKCTNENFKLHTIEVLDFSGVIWWSWNNYYCINYTSYGSLLGSSWSLVGIMTSGLIT